MVPKNKYRYILKDRFGIIEVAPLNEVDFTVNYERETDNKYFYSQQFNGKIIFSGATFKRLQEIERSIYICTEQQLTIYRKCSTGETIVFDGFFKLTNGSWDEGRCVVTLKFEKSVLDKCLNDNKNVKVNLLQEIQNRISVRPGTPAGTIEYKQCNANGNTEFYHDYWCGAGNPQDGNWRVVDYELQSPDGTHHFVRNTWARELVVLNCADTPGAGWSLVVDNCALTNTKTYAKPVITFNCQTESRYNGTEYYRSRNCEIVGYTQNTTIIDNGILLKDALLKLIEKFCGAYTLVSDFFQINPENPSAINYVTNEKTQTAHIVLFQKSDVKRPNVSGNAWRAEITWDKLVEMLSIVFNVNYSIDGDIIRLEHISYFSRNPGLDLTLPRYQKHVNGKRKYTYNVNDIPRQEIWQYKETSPLHAKSGVIDYKNYCAIGDGKNAEKRYVLDEFMTDVEWALSNPDADSDKVADEGFVIIATEKYGQEYYIITEEESIDGVRINNSLSFAKLLPRYHRHNRPLNKGYINGVEYLMLSTKPIKKGESITVPLCCSDNFDPLDTVQTFFGAGIVDSAKFQLTTETLELDLLYDVFNGLATNAAPVVANGVLQTPGNQALIFNLTITDADNGIADVFVSTQPNNGTAEILSHTEAKYTPNPGFGGYDFFYIKATDELGETSNGGAFLVEVTAPNEAPIAQPDLYYVYHGEPIAQTLGIFANDVDDAGFEIVNNTLVTAQGVGIIIAADGRFGYTPPVDFEGDDTFTYTIKDAQGLESSAMVTLRVGYKNKPIAVDDYYVAEKNTVFATNGQPGSRRLFHNDYTPDGLNYAYTTTAEFNKATAQGGEVTITADGLFTYTPPNDFEGQDSFTYQVNNVNGSAQGRAYINILPRIYVKLVKSDTRTVGHFGDAHWWKTADYTLYFYRDAAGTQPINVTGMGLKITMNELIERSNNTPFTSVWETGVVSGTSYQIFNDYIFYESEDLNGETYIISKTLSIAPGNYQIIN